MLAMEIQERLDAIVYDLQFAGKGKTVQLMFRDASNQPHILPLSSNAAGVVVFQNLALWQIMWATA